MTAPIGNPDNWAGVNIPLVRVNNAGREQKLATDYPVQLISVEDDVCTIAFEVEGKRVKTEITPEQFLEYRAQGVIDIGQKERPGEWKR
jgi:hypothetical protein